MKEWCFLMMLLTSMLYAQKQPTDTITALDEVTLIENLVKKRAIGNTPSTAIIPDNLKHYGPLEFAAALNQIPGLFVLSGALNTNRITIRGVGARTPFATDKLRMFFNGIPVTNGTGVSTIEAYDFENLGLLEVVKGPKASSMGANIGGAIAINTLAPRVGETFLQNNFLIGSFNFSKNNLIFNHSEKKFNISIRYDRLRTDGYRENNYFDRDGLLLTSSYQWNAKNKWDFLINQINYTAGIPSTLGLSDFTNNPRAAAQSWLDAQGFEDNKYTLAGITHGYVFNPNWKLSNTLFYTYLDHYEPRPFNILDEFTNGFGIRSLLNGTLAKGQFTLGTELYKDEYSWRTYENRYRETNGNGSLQGNQLSNNKEFRSQFNLFGTYKKVLNAKLQVQLGLNLNQTYFEYRDHNNFIAVSREFDPILLPSLTLSYSLGQGEIYANASRGFSNPGAEQSLRPDGALNPNINQEKGWNYEFGTRLSLIPKCWNMELTVYQLRIQDLLVNERLEEDISIERNAGKTRHNGLELATQANVKMGEKWIFKPQLSYTYNLHKFTEFVEEGVSFAGNALPGVPKHRLNAILEVTKGDRFFFSLVHQYVDDMPLNDENTLFSEGFQVVNFRTEYRILWSYPFQIGVNMGVNNLFDAQYAQSILINANSFGGTEPRFYYPGNAINYFVGVNLKYVIKNKILK